MQKISFCSLHSVPQVATYTVIMYESVKNICILHDLIEAENIRIILSQKKSFLTDQKINRPNLRNRNNQHGIITFEHYAYAITFWSI